MKMPSTTFLSDGIFFERNNSDFVFPYPSVRPRPVGPLTWLAARGPYAGHCTLQLASRDLWRTDLAPTPPPCAPSRVHAARADCPRRDAHTPVIHVRRTQTARQKLSRVADVHACTHEVMAARQAQRRTDTCHRQTPGRHPRTKGLQHRGLDLQTTPTITYRRKRRWATRDRPIAGPHRCSPHRLAHSTHATTSAGAKTFGTPFTTYVHRHPPSTYKHVRPSREGQAPRATSPPSHPY